MQLTSKLYKGFRLLLSVVNIDRKYALVIHSKIKKGITVTNFKKIQINQTTDHIKHGQIREANFIIDQ